MLKVIITKGLPGSGKSAWAKSVVSSAIPNKYKRISKDDLRLMMDNSLWSKANEKFVLDLRDYIILETLREGKIPIVDDTNLNSAHEKHIRELVKDIAEVEIQDFTDVSIETCIANDLKRPNSVGEKVIKQMYNQWLKPTSVKSPFYDSGLENAIVCDLDGTLCLFERDKKNAYNRDFENDYVNVAVASILINYHGNIIYVSGREDKYKEQTIEFFNRHNLLPKPDKLFMRKTGDNRNDSIVKQEIYDNEIKGKYNIAFILDDRDKVVSMWRSNGLVCFQVAEGDF